MRILGPACLVALPLFFAAPGGRAPAQDVPAPPTTGEVRVVGFVDVNPPQTPAGIDALRRYRQAAIDEPGALEVRVFQEIGRPSRLMLIETWHDQADYDAHLAGQGSDALKASLRPVELGVTDLRVHRVLPADPSSQRPAPRAAPPAAEAVFVMTHLDVPPPFFAALQPPLKAFVATTSKQPGALSFEVLQHVPPRQNHLTLVEAWSTRAAFEADRDSLSARAFRDTTVPILGALYDERLYREID